MKEQTATELSVDLLKSGDRAEFARMVDQFSGPLYRLAIKLLGNPQDAEDVLQNTFIQALQHISNFQERSSLSTWLYRIATNEALMVLRKRKPETTLTDAGPEAGEAEDLHPVQFVDWCCLPENELLSEEARTKLEDAVQNLPEKLRLVFLLRDIEGLSIQETSQILDLSETAVKSRLLRARLNLREQLSLYYKERLAKEPE
ncbi:MAG: sigma-70 family RNA polymerase sigma factor [Chloroflexota bacterium]